ncbi:MAG: ABC-2 family transporter protein [Candidatus Paceibacterota bacterium]|jgi:ABC-2 type transport system permease protein
MANGMKKYLTLIEVTWQRALTYRFTVFAYRIGEMLEVIILVFMWSAIYESQPVIKGYTLSEMISYVLIGNLIDVAIRNWMPNVIASDIKNGTLSAFLTKPINYMYYMFFKEAGRNSFAFIFSFITQIMIILFFLDKVIINFNLQITAVLLVMVLFAFIIEWQISYLVGLIAFWTDEVDGIYATVTQVRKFFAGGYFPLSLLPPLFVSMSFALPFAYSFFVPTQLYLGKIGIETGIKGLFVQIIWIILLNFIIKLAWQRGLKRYEGVGI